MTPRIRCKCFLLHDRRWQPRLQPGWNLLWRSNLASDFVYCSTYHLAVVFTIKLYTLIPFFCQATAIECLQLVCKLLTIPSELSSDFNSNNVTNLLPTTALVSVHLPLALARLPWL